MADEKTDGFVVEAHDEIVTKPIADKPTREDAKALGWSASEMDSAEKLGMITKAEDKKAPEAKAEPKVEPVPEAKPEPAKEEKPPEPKSHGNLPDMKFTPEEEATVTKTFGAGHPLRAFYFRAKNERKARQAAEDRARTLEAENAALKSIPKAPVEGEEDIENQPLTLKTLKELQRQEAAAIEAQRAQQSERANKVVSAQAEQEEFARSVYTDFDDTVNRAKDVMQNLDTLVPEKWKQAKVVELVRKLQVAAANADKIGLDDYNAAMIAYEIGQMHPDHGTVPKTGTAKVDPKGHGTLTPDQMRRAQENTQRRGSSAAVGGSGGRRVVSADEVALQDLVKMDAKTRLDFSQKHPDRYAKLLRG